jgi:transcriptional regulator with XRE-family HTH domain
MSEGVDDPGRALWSSSGVASLDDRIGGGVRAGDNVLWLGRPAVAAGFFPPFADTAAPGQARWIHTGPGEVAPTSASVEVVDLGPRGSEVRHLVDLVVDRGRRCDRLIVDLLDATYLRHGATAAVELYTQACPQLFDLGAVAYWPVDSEVLPASVIDRISRVAQVVLDVRADSLRIVKAEGRPPSAQGAVSQLTATTSGVPVVGREMGAGRLADGLRRLRRERNLSQKQLAELADVTPSAISQAETGRRNLSLETLLTLCERLPASIDELLGTQVTPRRLLARREGRTVAPQTKVLCDSPGLRTAIYRVQLGPLEKGAPFVTHKGTETILVARGLVLVDLGDDTPVLRAGDALVVTRDPVNGWTNLTEEPAELFWLLEATASVAEADASGA